MTASQQARFDYLTALQDDASDAVPALRATRESCLLAGLEAFRKVFHEAAREIWYRHTGCDIQGWSTSRHITMARWVAQMSAREYKLLRQIVASWQQQAAENYKIHLPFNRKWIRQARQRKIDVDRWLCPEPYTHSIAGQTVKLRVVDNPIEIFFMGTYFNTCLSPGGCNEMSVLANAAHANKQVVYAYAKDETVIGRQLIAINKDFQLVGYHNYVNCDGVLKADYEEIVRHFARFAGRIAIAANIQLPTDDQVATVENLGGHFWYDDGIHPWHNAITEPQ